MADRFRSFWLKEMSTTEFVVCLALLAVGMTMILRYDLEVLGTIVCLPACLLGGSRFGYSLSQTLFK